MRNLLALLLALLFCFSCVTSYAEGSRESSPQESVLKNGDYEYVVDEDGNAKLLSYSWDSHIFAFSFPDDSCDKFNPEYVFIERFMMASTYRRNYDYVVIVLLGTGIG